MQLEFACPNCDGTNRADPAAGAIHCRACGWSRTMPGGTDEVDGQQHCLACGCEDLWRQKDFSPRVGLTLVGLGILLSTIAWARMEPVWAIGILMAFALVDLVLYSVMRDVLVCYRCGARHRGLELSEDHPRFHLETHERYRQQAARLEQAGRAASGGSP
jgi:hypothetical protein